MAQDSRLFHSYQRSQKTITGGDVIALILVIALLYVGVRLAINAPEVIPGPDISLSPSTLPIYALFSVGRMAAAYLLSVAFSLVYGRVAAYHKNAEKVLMPLLDVLQSVPILSFLPVVLLSLSSILPEGIAAELASIILIFTSQAWNITFAWYQSLTTIPKELKEASSIFRLNTWMKFKSLELPFGMISLIWNSMMSWAGGWFFLMAAEIFTVGSRDFRLPGLGAYLNEAANQSDYRAIFGGVGVLILTVILLDQLVWRPLIAWSDRYKLEMVENDVQPTSWFLDLMRKANVTRFFSNKILTPLSECFDMLTLKQHLKALQPKEEKNHHKWIIVVSLIVFISGLGYALIRAAEMLFSVPIIQWWNIVLGVGATFIRVIIALAIALSWTIALGVLIGTNRRLAAILQPIVQVTASIPATALFPVLLLFILNLKNGLDIAAVLLMLMGTQWYLLFNIIAGASAIPQDLIYTSKLMGLSGWQRWRTLILPAIFPYLVTGAITASGGAWNASIVAEYQKFGGQTLTTTGIGSLIAQATASGDYPLLLASTLSMIITVVLVNRLFWRRLYRLAEEKYRME
ncbi:MAG: ABC transporter permease subunit [Leptolinea sp.]|jgi:NitT/TauT family transport system permease protein|nr:ABC transporter permease subunit [Leptolinea sp.]